MNAMRMMERGGNRVDFVIRRMTAYDAKHLQESTGGMRCICYGSEMYGHRSADLDDGQRRLLGLVAVTADGQVLGEAGYVSAPDDPETAELTVAVQAPYLHTAVVTRLLQELASHARTRGIKRLTTRAVLDTGEPLEEFAAAGLRPAQLLTVGGVTEMTFELE